MQTITSQKLKKGSNTPFSYKFESETENEGIKKITQPLLSKFEVARQRAIAEIIENGLKREYISFKTHRTNLHLGDIIRVKGLNYKIQKISLSLKDDGIFTIEAIRYFN